MSRRETEEPFSPNRKDYQEPHPLQSLERELVWAFIEEDDKLLKSCRSFGEYTKKGEVMDDYWDFAH